MDPRSSSRALLVLAMFLFASACPSRKSDAEALATGLKAKMKLPVDVDTRLDDVRASSRTELGYFLADVVRVVIAPKDCGL